MIEIYLDHKFQWPQEGLNCESHARHHLSLKLGSKLKYLNPKYLSLVNSEGATNDLVILCSGNILIQFCLFTCFIKGLARFILNRSVNNLQMRKLYKSLIWW